MDKKTARKLTHGWFTTDLRPGDRTLKQQIRGLGPLVAEIKGKTVLDVGCAEGCISTYLAGCGARSVHWVELVTGHVSMARTLDPLGTCSFEAGDANDYVPRSAYDIVLMLAVLHKLIDPSESCARIANAARSLCVIRFPGTSVNATIVDDRSNRVRHRIGDVMTKQLGFKLEREELGPFDEPTNYYRRET